MKRFLSFFLAVAMCLSLAACNGQQPVEEKPKESNAPTADAADTKSDESKNQAPDSTEVAAGLPTEGEPDAVQYYNSYIGADPSTLDISKRFDSYSSGVMNNTMEGLIRLEGITGEYVITPADAESWELSEDGTVWTFHLRDNIQWWDEVPVTADQYVYSLRRSADPEVGCPNSFFLQPIKNFKEVNSGELPIEELGVKAIDDKTLEITLVAPTPSFMHMMSSTVYYPQREDKIKEWGDKFGTEASYYVGNGPFKLEKWVHNSSLDYVKNDKYWDKDSVKLEKVHCAIMGEAATYLNAFQNGELDYTSTSASEWMELFEKQGAIHVPIMSQTVTLMPINTKDPLFQNVNVRKAFNLVMDREDMSEMCFNGLRLPCYGIIAPALTVGETSFRKIAGDPIKESQEALQAEGKTPRDLLIQGMEELGLGSDPSTVTVTLSVGGTSDAHKSNGEYLQQVFQNELGITCKIDMSEIGIYLDSLRRGDFQIGLNTYGTYYNDPYDMFAIFQEGNDLLGCQWVNPEYSSILEAASHELDEEKRAEMYMQLEDMLIEEDTIIIPLVYSLSQYFYQPYMRGCDVTPFGNSGYKHMYTSGRP